MSRKLALRLQADVRSVEDPSQRQKASLCIISAATSRISVSKDGKMHVDFKLRGVDE